MAIKFTYTSDQTPNWDRPRIKELNPSVLTNLDSPIINELLFNNEDGSKAELETMQIELLAEIMKLKSCILSAEMGIGKTYIGIALARLIRCIYPDKKVIITAPKNVVKNFKSLSDSALGELSMVCSGETHRVNKFIEVFNNVNIFIVTQSFWLNNEESVKFIYNHVEDFALSFYDEADSKNAVGFEIYSEFSRRVPYKVVSNATPIDKGIDLVCNLLYSIGVVDMKRNKFKNKYVDFKYRNGSLVSERVKVEEIYRDFGEYFVNKNRAELGAEIDIDLNFHKIFLNNTQRSWIGKGMRNDLALYSPENKSVLENIDNFAGLTKPELNSHNIPAFAKVLEILNQSTDDKVMIYAKNIPTLETMSMIIGMLGYNPYVINGSSKNMVKEISHNYNNDPKGIVLTNIIKGINLGNTTKVILYGTPPDVMQTIYRAIRGRSYKKLLVDWIYYPEFEYNVILDARDHIFKIDTVTDRDTKMLKTIENELDELKRYSFIPNNFFKKEGEENLVNGFIFKEYPF